jgi:hypothetical protein
VRELRRPSEFFGFPPENNSKEAAETRKNYYCPWLRQQCIKKSRLLEHPLGVCSVLHVGKPHVICPERIADAEILDWIAQKVLGKQTGYYLLKEVSLGRIGKLDFVVVEMENDSISKFFGIERVALDTTNTGQIVNAVDDFFKGEMKESYNYGINWKNVIKRTIPQIIAKGDVFEAWNAYIVWIVQDVLYDYLVKNYGLHLQDGFPEKPSTVLFIRSLSYDTKSMTYVFDPSPSVKSGSFANFQQVLRPNKIPPIEKFRKKLIELINNQKYIRLK